MNREENREPERAREAFAGKKGEERAAAGCGEKPEKERAVEVCEERIREGLAGKSCEEKKENGLARETCKGNGKAESRKTGSLLGLVLAFVICAGLAVGVMAFYPWLAREVQLGKQVYSQEEWEKRTEEISRTEGEEENGPETASESVQTDGERGPETSGESSAAAMSGVETESGDEWTETGDGYYGVYDGRGYYIDRVYIEPGIYISPYQENVIYAGDEVWVMPEYGKVRPMAEMLILAAGVLVTAAAFILAAVKRLGMVNLTAFKMPFELMAILGTCILAVADGCGMGIPMLMSAVTGESAAMLGGGYYHLSPRTAQWTVLAVNYGAWLFLGLTVFWMAGTAASLFALGPVRWFKERTATGILLRFVKRTAVRGCRQMEQIDLRDKSTRTLFKIVGINFLILSVLCGLWFFGIFGLFVYSAALYAVLRRLYRRVQEKYRILLKATNELAEGNLDVEITEELGVFEPFKGEIQKIQAGFKKAVDAEVKSQRMKTELITNVSHDLKTPLTAIITYVNLLKQPDITQKEREEYIKVLDQKSMRLKALIEDLFEVSKANSRNISLNLVDVDVVSLMKQVRLELDDKIRESGIDFRFRFPEEKAVLFLDSEKTYRVFENLLVNIVKYGMPGTRAYVEIETSGKQEEGGAQASGKRGREETGGRRCEAWDTAGRSAGTNVQTAEKSQAPGEVRITMKNISAAELSEDGPSLTDRFVRGDKSRNTEGSGLGLAIAKSFVELQKGRFEVETEADLFKVTIVWKTGR